MYHCNDCIITSGVSEPFELRLKSLATVMSGIGAPTVGDLGVLTPPKIMRHLTEIPNFTMLNYRHLLSAYILYNLLLIRPITSYFFAAKLTL
jgi:hypothetical protein